MSARDGLTWGMRVPELLNANCYGWARYNGNGRDGWSLSMRDRISGKHRYFSANYEAGSGYSFYEVLRAGSEYALISGPYKRLADVQRAGVNYLIEHYWLKLD